VNYLVNICRTELLSARATRPLSNEDEYRDIIWPCTILVQSYTNQPPKLHNRGAPEWPNARPSGVHRKVSCETKNIYLKRSDHIAFLNMPYQYKIPRTELLPAKSKTAIVKCRRREVSVVCSADVWSWSCLVLVGFRHSFGYHIRHAPRQALRPRNN
jgi:hypothetical protein